MIPNELKTIDFTFPQIYLVNIIIYILLMNQSRPRKLRDLPVQSYGDPHVLEWEFELILDHSPYPFSVYLLNTSLFLIFLDLSFI